MEKVYAVYRENVDGDTYWLVDQSANGLLLKNAELLANVSSMNWDTVFTVIELTEESKLPNPYMTYKLTWHGGKIASIFKAGHKFIPA